MGTTNYFRTFFEDTKDYDLFIDELRAYREQTAEFAEFFTSARLPNGNLYCPTLTSCLHQVNSLVLNFLNYQQNDEGEEK